MCIRRLIVCCLLFLALVSAGPFGASLSGRDSANAPIRVATSDAAMTAKTRGVRHCQRGIAGLVSCSIDKTIVRTEFGPRSDGAGNKLDVSEAPLPSDQHVSEHFRPPRLS
ncbi:hypothetical protein E2A64_06785 [Pseudohoeflea suaedae]|uniref:Uncharacterized protein n=1 Tax=Pseudohoeflea suaedae TaxID=877384 RepID=A0A4R5PNZ4_9HYPH|nr:hypothetical protein [Pseudohoeflea suaedae]TDH38794.1 hypothetical protein E2A64_06785 [Pseudohoeflea suaedae]